MRVLWWCALCIPSGLRRVGDNPNMVEMVYTELVEAIAAAGLERWARHPKLSDAGKIRRALQVTSMGLGF